MAKHFRSAPARRSSRARRVAAGGLAAVCAVSIGLANAGSADALSVATVPSVPAISVPTAPSLPSIAASGLSTLRAGFGTIWGDSAADGVARNPAGVNVPSLDPGSLLTIENAIGARTAWQRSITGSGVAVALLDSGVTPVPGLNSPGKVVYGPDLSIEQNGPLVDTDTYGHGTFLAGIIAAHDPATLVSSTIGKLDGTTQLGVAPDAKVEALKLATTDGSTDVSQVIAALDWVTQHPTLADGTRVRVVNLSYGTDSTQDYRLDPLAAAAENAWRHGIVVVVSAGNEGNDAGRLTDPAIDPYVLAVGASDSRNTVAGWSSPVPAAFSNGGTSDRHVDLLAPGRSIVSLRDPNSFIDTAHPEGRVAGDSTGRLFRGSGTSQAAAVVSGAVALLLQAYPSATPDQVKAALVGSATAVSASPLLAGAGQINVLSALDRLRTLVAARAGTQNWPVSTGQGSLETARGGNDLVDPNGTPLSGEIDVQGNPWNAATWWAATSQLRSWQAGTWNGATWTGGGWVTDGSAYTSARWSSADWSSARWSTADWDSARWSSAGWSSARWSSARWSSAAWQ